MTTVFIAGSIKIKNLDRRFVERIRNIVDKKFQIVVGDAAGVDTSIQKELLSMLANNVTVYCSGDKPRTNLGNWKIRSITSTEEPGTRAFYTSKDKEMALIADFGLMMWDAASAGTLNNILEMVLLNKKCAVFVNKNKSFVDVKNPDDLIPLLAEMSSGSRILADKKIGLKNKLTRIYNPILEFNIAQ